MRKFTTLMAAFAATIAVNAATVTWEGSNVTEVANNENIDGVTFTVDDNISFTVDKGTASDDCIFRKNTTYPGLIVLRAHSTLTLKAENASITSIKFGINTTIGTSTSPNWIMTADGNQYDATNDTWTGDSSEIVFTVGKVTQILSMEIAYSVDEGSDTPDPTPGEFKTAELFFNESQLASGADAQNIKLSNNGVEIDFTSNSNNAQVDKSNGFFGTSESYETLQYRYRAGGKSSNGINSTNKGVITLPCDGTLYIYAFNNQSDDRDLQIIQNDVTVFSHTYSASEAVNADNNASRKVYPVYSAELKKGTAYFLWPTNQLMLFGFKFEPKKSISTVVEEIEITDIKDMPAYDLMGRRVSDNYKGIVIQGGKKFIRK